MNMFDMNKEHAKFESRKRIIKVFFVFSLLLSLVAGLICLYLVVSAVRHVEKHGLKSVVEEVWHGEDHRGNTNDR